MKTKTIKAKALLEAEFTVEVDTSNHDHRKELHYVAYDLAHKEASEIARSVSMQNGDVYVLEIEILDESL